MPPSKPYSIARAELIAEQVGRFATQHVHQLAGHHANLAFWIAEAAAAVRTIDEYQQRFRQLRDAQVAWVRQHDTKITRYCPVCRGACEFGPQTPDRPHRVPSEDLAAAREAVRNAVRQFLVRLYHAGFVSEAEVRRSADLVGASIEPEDLERGDEAR
ncbi:hypothetical protein WMF20_01285 [Sorangium sp. So ce834]|uniref:hypothetical protein n=1 Tax=Sorangium sp. So ce834 TaxID=3133321 RepID=UPI003F6365D5